MTKGLLRGQKEIILRKNGSAEGVLGDARREGPGHIPSLGAPNEFKTFFLKCEKREKTLSRGHVTFRWGP